MDEKERNKQQAQDIPESAPEAESNSAAVLRRLGKLADEPAPEMPPSEKNARSFWENYWYHYKWRTIIIAFVAIFVIVGSVQLLTREKPDVYIMYCGPSYINPDVNEGFRSAVRQVMEDYNGDGEKGILLTDITYMNPAQVMEAYKIAEAEGVDIAIDNSAQYNAYQKFSMEVFSGESVICFLDPELFASVNAAGGLLTIAEVLGEGWETLIPESARVGETGIRLSEIPFGQYFTVFGDIREDTVLCIRRLSTMSFLKGQKKTERIHGYHVELFRAMAAFDFPEGYVPPAE